MIRSVTKRQLFLFTLHFAARLQILALKNIAPTSIASEQAFSVSASFISKIRSLLSDQAIDDLMFEKGYFANEDYFYN